jgi:hypothetical protein
VSILLNSPAASDKYDFSKMSHFIKELWNPFQHQTFIL